MKTIRYCIFFLVLLSLSNIFPAGNGKRINNVATSSQLNSTGFNGVRSYSNIQSRLLNFMQKTGAVHLSAKLLSPNSTPAVTTKIFQRVNFSTPITHNFSNVIIDSEFGTPRLIDVQSNIKSKNAIQSNNDASVQAMAFLKDNKSLLRISNPQDEFLLKSINRDEEGITHVRYTQTYNGLEVWGKEIYVHVDSYGNVTSLTGRFAATPESINDLSGKIDATAAMDKASLDLKSRISISSISPQMEKLLNYNGPSTKKIIWYDKNEQPHLAWFVEIRSGIAQDWYYFIDAENGYVLNSYNNVCFDGASTGSGTDLNNVTRTFGTYQVGSTYYMLDVSQPMFNAAQSQLPNNPIGAIQCLDLKNTDLSNTSQFSYVSSTNNQWTDSASVSATYNAITTYQYYLNVYNRNSIDNKGMTIYSIIHATENGQPMENAFWSGTVMCYGDGKTYFKPLAGGLDVGAHEMTHGVTQNSSNLEYQNQSGALNESMSDVFGKLVDTTTWQIGSTIIKDLQTFPSGALRDMSNPHNGGNPGDPCWQPATLNELVNTTSDNGGVHVNSGIPNYAFYFVASSIGRPSAGKIWYLAETSYLTRSSQFVDERIATEKAATELFGASSNELTAVQNAWDKVGVLESGATTPPPTSQLEGQNWILSINTSSSDPNSIYMAKTVVQSSSDYFVLSQTPVSNRPAVSDTSGIILFIDGNNNLRALYANPQNLQEQLIEGSGVWGSVAIGPGLNSFAITSKFIDTTIYYFDLLDSTKSNAFKIRTPAYDANNVSTALYADAMSFDLTGRYILFDTYNSVNGASGDITFWNINIIDISTGNIQSVFPPQQEGISIGNPSFSKTSQTRFTFDYWNTKQNQFAVYAADFNTGNLGLVDNTADLGYPTYSGDDNTIAYHTKFNINSVFHDVILQMPLQSDHITGTGTSKLYLADATYPVWFVIGERITDVKTTPVLIPQEFALQQNYPNPFNPSTIITYQLPIINYVTLKVYDVLGRVVKTLVNERQAAGMHSVTFNAAGLSSGIYFYRITCLPDRQAAGNFTDVKKLVLLK